MIAFFLIPFVEHLTERTKQAVVDYVLPASWSAYVGHWFAPAYAIFWSAVLLLVLGQWSVLGLFIASGGSLMWYEISSIWRQRKREAVPASTRGLDKELTLG